MLHSFSTAIFTITDGLIDRRRCSRAEASYNLSEVKDPYGIVRGHAGEHVPRLGVVAVVDELERCQPLPAEANTIVLQNSK